MITATENGEMAAFSGQCAFGLTKREYIAALALQGILANSFANDEFTSQMAAAQAVSHADRLLEELSQ